jgi:hypothetical protein
MSSGVLAGRIRSRERSVGPTRTPALPGCSVPPGAWGPFSITHSRRKATRTGGGAGAMWTGTTPRPMARSARAAA